MRRAIAAVAMSAAATLGLVVVSPAVGDPVALAAQLSWPAAAPFSGTSAVGALFSDHNGRLAHFCTASVVHSPHGNLLITAAHCIQGKDLKPAGAITFAPGYHDGRFPHGRWIVRAAYVDSAWKKRRDPDDDVAFLLAGRPGLRIEKYTGSEALETGTPLPQQVRVIGYPDRNNLPVTCGASARAFDPGHLHQMVFDCDGYTNGTSGGPFLAHATAAGTGKVIGVIGGYQEGGDTPNVSYSARFLANVAALYKTATS
ncbi:MAG TPA: serine protease [Streptosporangiaceae bacterium]|nr:serine protease [Streptosporangiaceae bacterium]